MKPKTEYRSCRLCCGSRVNPDGPGMCPRCDGTARDPEDVHIDIEKMGDELIRRSLRSSHTHKLLSIVDASDPQRGVQTTPSNDIDPSADLKRGVRLIFITAAVCFLLGLLTGLIAGCAQPPQNTPPIGESARDSVRVTAERERAIFTAQAEAESYGWTFASGVADFARIGVWYKSEPYYTIGLRVFQLAPEAPDTVTCRTITHAKSPDVTICTQPGATASFTWMDAEGPNQATTYHVILCDLQPGDMYCAKAHHSEDWLQLRRLDMRRVRR